MTTSFTASHIPGKGRGKFLGYPTINMAIPSGFELEDGIYAVWVTIESIRFRGAMHWGPIPTFDSADHSLEVFVLGAEDGALDRADLSVVSVQVVKKLRDVMKFPSVDALTTQMEQDVRLVRKTLQE